MTTQQTALDTYLQRLPMIRDKIGALQKLADDHFGHDPNAIQWGHIGDLGRVDQALDDLLAIFDGHDERGGCDGYLAQTFTSPKRQRPETAPTLGEKIPTG